MSFQVIGATGKDPDFQNRCWGGIMTCSVAIIATTLNDGSITSQAGADLTTQASKDQALKFAKLAHLSSDRTIANLVLLNSTISVNPSAAEDSAIQFQLNQVWTVLMAIG
jgi:hypothetical protein